MCVWFIASATQELKQVNVKDITESVLDIMDDVEEAIEEHEED